MDRSAESDSHVREVQALFIRHQPAVRAMAIALTGDFGVAEDVDELEPLLPESAAVRVECWDCGMLHGVLCEASKTACGSLLAASRFPQPSAHRPSVVRWFSLATSLALLLAGCLFGVVTVSWAGLASPAYPVHR